MYDNIFYVSYSYSRDLDNYIRQLRNKMKYQFGMNVLETSKMYFPENFLLKVINAPTDTHAESIVLDFWKKTRDKNFNDEVTKKTEKFNRYLYEHQSEIISTLEKTFNKKFPFTHNINIFLTTFYRCPYNYPNWFMSYTNGTSEILKDTVIHEMNHFMFYFYWKDKLSSRMTEEQFENLKEALAVLTSSNPDKENEFKPNILNIQKFVQANSGKPLKEIIELTLKSKIFSEKNKL